MPSKLYILCGLPFSGKTTLAKSFALKNNFQYMSFDELWMELERNDPQFPTDKTEGWSYVRKSVQKRIEKYLKTGLSVVYDDTNVKAEHRKEWIDLAHDVQSKPVIVFANTSQELINDRRNINLKTQERHDVQEKNWTNAIEQFEVPDSFKENAEVVLATDIAL
jgi:predicted kinase